MLNKIEYQEINNGDFQYKAKTNTCSFSFKNENHKEIKDVLKIPETISMFGENLIVDEVSYVGKWAIKETNFLMLSKNIKYVHKPLLYEKGCPIYFITANENKNYKSINGSLYSKNGKNLIYLYDDAEEVYISDNVKEIFPYSINGLKKLRILHIPSSVKTICNMAILGCENLEEIYFEGPIDLIKSDNFNYCPKLKDIHFPSYVKRAFVDVKKGPSIIMHKLSGQLYWENQMIHSTTCLSIDDIDLKGSDSYTISEKYKQISPLAFYRNLDIRRLDMNDDIEAIPDSFAHSAINLEYVKLPRNVQTIGNSAFCGTALTKIMIPKKCIKIRNYAFCDCKNLKEITIPSDIEFLGQNIVTSGYTKIKVKNGGFNNDIFSIKNGFIIENKTNNIVALMNNDIEEVSIPDGVEAIPAFLFDKCTKIKKITLTNTIKTIEPMLFNHVQALKKLIFPKVLKK